jgi:hypothetical protein
VCIGSICLAIAGNRIRSRRRAPEELVDQGFDVGGRILSILPLGAVPIVVLAVLDGGVEIVLVTVLVATVPRPPLGGCVAVERAVTGGTGAAAVVAGTGVVLAVELDGFSASLTSATHSTASETTITVLSATIGARQLAGAARRVRAAAPQPRHQS